MELNLFQCENPEFETAFLKILDNARDRGLLDENSTLSVSFLPPEQIHALNRDYRQVDRPTDVLSFAMQDALENLDESDLGDIFINTQAIEDQAREYGHTPFREGCFLFAHGLLHLLGYDHMEPEEEKQMRLLQHELLDSVASR